MTSVITKHLNVFTAEQVKESVSETNNNTLYLGFGRVSPWANDAVPEQANTSDQNMRDVWSTMIGGKLITENSMEHVIERNQWATGISYSAYDDKDTDLYSHDFYVITTDFNVYKCLDNVNSSNSTVEPTSTNPATITQTADGYIWKYMFTLNSEDKYRFLNDDYFPVRTLTVDNGSTQWQVQSQAVEGAIYLIKIEDAGTYTNDNVSIVIIGDGTGANASCNVNTSSNTLHTMTIDDYGTGYTYASASITGGAGSGGSLRVVLSPPNGHGSDPLYELGGSNLMLNVRLRGTENGTLPIVNDLRQIILLKDPYTVGTTNAYSNTTFSQLKDLSLTGVSSDYDEDEYVYQGASLSTATFAGKVVEWDSANSQLLLNNTTGTPTSDTLIGDTTGSTSFVTSVENEDLTKNSGKILYIQNIPEIQRDEFQTENFRIVLKY